MTDHEYGAMIWCWERVGQRQGLGVRTFPLPTMATDPGEIVDAAGEGDHAAHAAAVLQPRPFPDRARPPREGAVLPKRGSAASSRWWMAPMPRR